MIGLICRRRPVGRRPRDVGLATELHDLAEDVVDEDGAADGTMLDQTIGDTMATMAVMKSEPTQKIFTETKSMSQFTLR